MDRSLREAELRESVDFCCREFHGRNDRYDSLLWQVHQYDHGSSEIVHVLTRANLLGASVLEALGRYTAAIEKMARSYEQA
jgi:hypothetical protein